MKHLEKPNWQKKAAEKKDFVAGFAVRFFADSAWSRSGIYL